MVVTKYLFQFGFFPWNSYVVLRRYENKPYFPPRILGLEKTDSYIKYDLVQLMALFFHRSQLLVSPQASSGVAGAPWKFQAFLSPVVRLNTWMTQHGSGLSMAYGWLFHILHSAMASGTMRRIVSPRITIGIVRRTRRLRKSQKLCWNHSLTQALGIRKSWCWLVPPGTTSKGKGASDPRMGSKSP